MFKLVNIKYKNIVDIKDLIFPKGKISTIIGKSGSGKTTLLKMLNKLISPDSGDIFYKNEDLKTIDSVKLRREVLMLQQNPVIFTGSIRDNLLIGLKFSEKTLVEDEVLIELMDKIRLNKNLDEDTSKLSGGEKQRLALARLLLMEPEVLLLDEPSSALDEESEKIIIEGIVSYVRDRNISLIMVSHSNLIANTYSDYIYNISKNDFLKLEV